jgi:outer membrane biosynthesis protein TonB
VPYFHIRATGFGQFHGFSAAVLFPATAYAILDSPQEKEENDMKVRRLLYILLVVCMLLNLTACGGSSKAEMMDANDMAWVEEAPAEAPAETAPVEEAPVEEAPAEEESVVEAAAEEAPAEEAAAPKAQPAAKKAAPKGKKPMGKPKKK